MGVCVPCMLYVRGGGGVLEAKAVWWLHAGTPKSCVSEILGIVGGLLETLETLVEDVENFEGGGDFVCIRKAGGSRIDFLVAICGIEVFFEQKKASKEEKMGVMIYGVGEIWIPLSARESSAVSYVRGERGYET